jgi:hypothetical protein
MGSSEDTVTDAKRVVVTVPAGRSPMLFAPHAIALVAALGWIFPSLGIGVSLPLAVMLLGAWWTREPALPRTYIFDHRGLTIEVGGLRDFVAWGDVRAVLVRGSWVYATTVHGNARIEVPDEARRAAISAMLPPLDPRAAGTPQPSILGLILALYGVVLGVVLLAVFFMREHGCP